MKLTFISLLLVLLGTDFIHAQVTTNQSNSPKSEEVKATSAAIDADSTILEDPEIHPEFPGGLDALVNFIGSNLKYPELAQSSGIQGRVFVQFLVETDGSVSNIKTVRDIGGGCGKEACRVVSLMPKWTPGVQNGKNVRVKFTLPIQFKLTKSADYVYDKVEKKPSFPGGTEALAKFIDKNIKKPKGVLKKGETAKVSVQFIVNQDGSLSNIETKDNLNEALLKEAIRLVTIMPKWLPGEDEGEAVKVRYALPIEFKK